MTTLLKTFHSFDIDSASLVLWLFKKTQRPTGQPPGFLGRWVDTGGDLEAKLKAAVAAEQDRIHEIQEYSLLAQNNESSALAIDALITNAGLIAQQAAAELPGRRVKAMKQIQETNFYAIKLTSSGQTIYAVRKAETSWQTKSMKDIIYAFFSGTRLSLDEKPSFRISPTLDFFIFDAKVLILHKGHFESILAYKESHIKDFEKLQKEKAFKALFTDIDPIIAFVGTNKIHLRRACAIREMGHYKNKQFIARLRKDHAKYHLTIKFDSNGLIVPTEETAADIIRAMLDHRLLSPFSDNLYDVQDAAVVS